MAAAQRRFRLSLQAKVLVAVLGFLVLLPILTLWIVNGHMERQMEDEARQTLATAEAVFLKSLDNRSRNILERYRTVVEEARFKVTAFPTLVILDPSGKELRRQVGAFSTGADFAAWLAAGK